jgi:hypothetical protein
LQIQALEQTPGLGEAETRARLQSDGPYELPSARPRGVLAIAWEVVRQPMFLLLAGCALIYLVFGESQEALVLLAFAVVVMGITLYQERKTERALDALWKIRLAIHDCSQSAAKQKTIRKVPLNSAFSVAVPRAALVAWLALAAVARIADAGPLDDAASAHERDDDATALQLLRPLAEDGNAFAQFALGFIYDTAKGIPQDDAEAAKWYRKAADQGLAGAQYNLGAMYADGHGVSLDYVEAYRWLSVAASRFPAENRDVAVNMRDLVAAKMTPTQIAEAQKLAREWKPK